MPVELIAKIQQKNNGAFKLIDVADLDAGNLDVVMQLIAGGGVVGGVHATTPVGEIAVQRKTTTGAPTHVATGATLCWNEVDEILYASQGAGAWVPVGGGTHPNLAVHDALGLATDVELAGHIDDASDAHAATAIDFTPSGRLTGSTMQSVLQQVDRLIPFFHTMNAVDDGIDPTGVVGSDAGFQAIIDACIVAGGGIIVGIPGSFLLNTGLNFSGLAGKTNGVVFQMAGSGRRTALVPLRRVDGVTRFINASGGSAIKAYGQSTGNNPISGLILRDFFIENTVALAATNAAQTLTLTAGAVNDTFKLTYDFQASSTITIPAGGFASVTGAQIKTALLSLYEWKAMPAALQATDITVTTVSAGVFRIDFTGTLGGRPIGPLTVTNTSGATAGSVAQTVVGVATYTVDLDYVMVNSEISGVSLFGNNYAGNGFQWLNMAHGQNVLQRLISENFPNGYGYRLGCELTTNVPAGVNGGNSHFSSLISNHCLVGFDLTSRGNGPFDGNTFDSLKAWGGSTDIAGSIGIAMNGSVSNNVFNAPHVERCNTGIWFNRTRANVINAPLISYPQGTQDIGTTALRFAGPNNTFGNFVFGVSMAGTRFDFGVSFEDQAQGNWVYGSDVDNNRVGTLYRDISVPADNVFVQTDRIAAKTFQMPGYDVTAKSLTLIDGFPETTDVVLPLAEGGLGRLENLLLYSDAFDNAAWVKGASGGQSVPTITADSSTGPYGETLADTYHQNSVLGGNNELHQIRVESDLTNRTFAARIWVKGKTVGTAGKLWNLRIQEGVSGENHLSVGGTVALSESLWLPCVTSYEFLAPTSVDLRLMTWGSGLVQNDEVYVFGGQLVEDAEVNAYVATGATARALGYGLQLNGASLIAPSVVSPAQTAEGSMVWDNNDDHLTIGTGAGRKTLANSDDGVSSFAKSGSTPLTGAVTISGGSNVTLTQTGQDVSIAATTGTSPSFLSIEKWGI